MIGPNPRIASILVLAVFICDGGCAPSRPPSPAFNEDVVFAQSSSTAMIAYERGDVRLAAKLYEEALKRAEAMDDAKAVEDSAYNLAACEISLGQYDPARHHLEEAKYSTTRRRKNSDPILLLLAKLVYIQEHDAESELLARPLLDSTATLTRLQAQVLLTLIACDRGELAAAKSRGAVLREMCDKTRDLSPSISADVEKAFGAISRLERQPRDAAEHFDRETVLLQAAHRYRDIVHALARSAAAHDEAGETDAAADRFYRAARACAANDDIPRSAELAQKALAAATKAGDLQLKQIVQNFISETRAHAGP